MEQKYLRVYLCNLAISAMQCYACGRNPVHRHGKSVIMTSPCPSFTIVKLDFTQANDGICQQQLWDRLSFGC